MSSLAQRITDFAVAVAAQIKSIKNDTRWTNARTPTAHAATHAAGGSDSLGDALVGTINGVAGTVRVGSADTAGFSGVAAWKSGVDAGLSNTSGSYWLAQGASAGHSNTSGNSWIAQGVNAGRSNAIGNSWIAQGVNAGRSNTSGSYWLAQGENAGYSNTVGSNWLAQGVNAGYSNTVGSNWLAYGVNAAFDNIDSSNFICVGFNTGRGWLHGDGNIIIGSYISGLPATLANNIIIGTGDGVIRYQFDGAIHNLSGSSSISGNIKIAESAAFANLPTPSGSLNGYYRTLLSSTVPPRAFGRLVRCNGTNWIDFDGTTITA